jgi:CheY-like chemotaxis protein
VLAEGLRSVGYLAEVAHDGPSGLLAARAFRPAVALLDIGLPVMDGYQLVARLRAEELGQLRLVAITGYGQDADKARARDAGFDEHLVKPVDLDRVLDVVTRLSS